MTRPEGRLRPGEPGYLKQEWAAAVRNPWWWALQAVYVAVAGVTYLVVVR